MCDICFRLRWLAKRLKGSLVLGTGACKTSGMTAGMGYMQEEVSKTDKIGAFVDDSI